MRTLLALALLTSTVLPAASAQLASQGDETPEHFVRRVYSQYRHNGPGISMARPAGAAFYTPAMLDAFAKDREASHGEVGAIDGDFVCNCQDFDALRVTKVTVSPGADNTVQAQVAFVNLKQHNVVTLTLSRTQQGWRIADVAENDVKSLMTLLKDSIAHPAQNSASDSASPSPSPQKP